MFCNIIPVMSECNAKGTSGKTKRHRGSHNKWSVKSPKEEVEAHKDSVARVTAMLPWDKVSQVLREPITQIKEQ